ncbi:MAG: hypothetical protein ACRDEA_00500 [Microcystaceae cyanobacterium]
MNTFRQNCLYELSDEWKQYYDEAEVPGIGQCLGYYFARPASYMIEGNSIADCWIVNKERKSSSWI